MDVPSLDKEKVHRVDELMRVGNLAEARNLLHSLGATPWSLNRRMQLALRLNAFQEIQPLWEHFRTLKASAMEQALARSLWACARAAQRFADDYVSKVDDAVLAVGDDGAEVGYFLATEAWMRHDYRRAEQILRHCKPTAPRARARFLIIRSMIAAAGDDIHQRGDECEQALDMLLNEAPNEFAYLSSTLWSFSTLTREVPLPYHANALHEIEQSVNWNKMLGDVRLHVLRAFGWTALLEGDLISALRLFREARDSAEVSTTRLLAHCDYANAANLAGSRAVALAELRYALELCGQIEWNAVKGEGSVVLLVLAGAAGPMDPVAARDLLEFAVHTITRQITPNWVLQHGRHLDAFIAEATAFVAAGNNEFFEAQRQASAACEDFSRMGYCWRAGRMALRDD